MANKYKIDPSKIEGFDNLSADEKVAALLNQEIEVEQTEPADVTKLKTSLSKANSEAAEYKRLLREKQTEAERAEADRAEREKALQDELASYRDKERISSYKAQLMSAGVDSRTTGSRPTGSGPVCGPFCGPGPGSTMVIPCRPPRPRGPAAWAPPDPTRTRERHRPARRAGPRTGPPPPAAPPGAPNRSSRRGCTAPAAGSC